MHFGYGIGINDLASQCPNIAKEWHIAKNGNLTSKWLASVVVKLLGGQKTVLMMG
jgi:hypothetical protein